MPEDGGNYTDAGPMLVARYYFEVYGFEVPNQRRLRTFESPGFTGYTRQWDYQDPSAPTRFADVFIYTSATDESATFQDTESIAPGAEPLYTSPRFNSLTQLINNLIVGLGDRDPGFPGLETVARRDFDTFDPEEISDSVENGTMYQTELNSPVSTLTCPSECYPGTPLNIGPTYIYWRVVRRMELP